MKKKILFILHLPPPVHGAAMVGQFLKESKYINDSFDANYINLTTASSLENMGKANVGKVFDLLRLQITVLKTILQKRYDLYYVSINAKGPGYYKDMMVVFILKIFGRKVIYHFHNKGVATMQHKWLDNLLYRVTFKKTKSILLSQLLYSDIAKYVKEEDVFYCANGIPEYENAAIARQDYSHRPEICKLLFFSNMNIAKGVYDLLNACKILKQRKIAFECHFVGAWSELTEEQVKRYLIQEELSETIYLHGKQVGFDKFKYFQNADIFVLPSHNECFPLVNLEAMQFSLPIVSTSTGGIADMVIDGETGFLVSPKDTKALAEKLELLIMNPDMRLKMGRAGRKLYEEFFTLNRFEFNMKNILDSAIMN